MLTRYSTKHALSFTVAVALWMVDAYTSRALAAGFQIFGLGVRGQGVAHAGMASRADGPETAYYNPVGMVYLMDSQASVGLTQHFVEASFSGRGEYSALTGPLEGFGFENSTRGSEGGTRTAPALGVYATHDYSERLKFGLAINTPFGLSSKYSRDWAGRYLAVKSSLITININPSLAVKLSDELTVAVGINAIYAEAELTQAIDLGLLLAPAGRVPGQLENDGYSTIEGDDWGYGVNLGLIFEPVPGTRLGISYRSEQELDISGRVEFDTPAPLPPPLDSALGRGRATSALSLPQWASFSLTQRFSPTWSVSLDATWTHWSVIDKLHIKFPGNPVQPETVLPTDWTDSWRYALGAVHNLSSRWDLRAGIALDHTPVPNPASYTPRIPAGDGVSVALGASYVVNRSLSLDIAYTHIFIDALDIDRTEGVHRLVGDYDGSVDIVAAQLIYSFH